MVTSWVSLSIAGSRRMWLSSSMLNVIPRCAAATLSARISPASVGTPILLSSASRIATCELLSTRSTSLASSTSPRPSRPSIACRRFACSCVCSRSARTTRRSAASWLLRSSSSCAVRTALAACSAKNSRSPTCSSGHGPGSAR